MRVFFFCLLLSLVGALEAQMLLEEGFEEGLSSQIWGESKEEKGSFLRIEPRDGGQCLHLFGDRSPSTLSTRQPIPNIAYTLEYDFYQPGEEIGGYQAVVHHPRPEGHSYWWLEYGPQRFFLYTFAGGQWFNRWQAHGFPSNRWYRIRIQNVPFGVRVSIYDEGGKNLLVQSPLIPHDDGGPAGILFSAVGTSQGVWGMKIDNVRLYITPIGERDDYQYRRSVLGIVERILKQEEVATLWKEGEKEFQRLEEALTRIERTPPEDWSAYISANGHFDEVLKKMGKDYHEEVISRMDKRRNGWVMVDLKEKFDAEGHLLGITLPSTGPLYEVEGIPFLLVGFGPNCVLQDLPSRSQRSFRIDGEAQKIALLLAPIYDEELYYHDDSLVDVLQVELRYEDGFRERIVPLPLGWKPPLPYGVGRPPFPNKEVGVYIIEPGHKAKIKEMLLCDDAIQAGWALFALSYKEGLPEEQAILRGTKFKEIKVKPIPPKITTTREGLILQNAFLQLVLDNKVGLLRSLKGIFPGRLTTAKGSPLFALEAKGRLIYSDEFSVEKIETKEGKNGAKIFYTLRAPAIPLRARLFINADETERMQWDLEVENLGGETLNIRVIFPLLDGLDLGERVGWYFPQRGGAVSELPLEGLSSYGGMAWLQVLDIHRMEGGGVYIRSDDTTGMYKILALRYAPEGSQPLRVADIPQPAHPLDPWRAKTNTHLSIQYLPTSLPPGEKASYPSATLSLHQGDWRVALRDYYLWLKTWWRAKRPCPKTFKYGFYALVGGTPQREEDLGREFGSYDWWHIFRFWTVDYPDELKEDLEALQKEAERANAWGQAIGLYIEGMLLEKKRRIAKEKGAEWAMMDDKGDYYTYYSTEENPVWNICPAVKEWQEWDAKAYAEIASRVPLCAMYVDSTGSRWAEVCYNPLHKHETPGIWVRGCAELFESIRQAVTKVNPEIAIHSEEPGSDYMAMHEDGSWSHSLWTNLSGDEEYNPAGLNYFRFVLPQFKMYEIPSYRHALWRCKLAFFNGEGLWTSFPDALRKELFAKWMPILRKYADVFMSEDVEMAIPVVAPPLYINRFHKGGQTIYTIYNAGLRTHRAEVYLPAPPKGHLSALVGDTPSYEKRDGQVVLKLTVHPHEVQCLLFE